MRKLILLIPLIVTFCPLRGQKIEYPETQHVPFKEMIHSTTVVDPYRWLEDDRSEETMNWVREQNQVTSEYLQQIPFREKLKDRIGQLWEFERRSAPDLKAGWYYQYKNMGRENFDVLFRYKAGREPEEELVINPNLLSDEGVLSMRFFSVSNDGRYGAYSISRAGSDETDILIMDLDTKNTLPETISGVKFSSIGWLKDGFYYSRFDQFFSDETTLTDQERTDGSEKFAGRDVYHKVYFHKVGTPVNSDKLIYEDPKDPLKTFQARVSEDENYLFISSSKSSSGNDLRIKNIQNDSPFAAVAEGFENRWSVIDSDNNAILLLTNENAPRYRVMRMEFGKPEKRVLIPEREETLKGMIRAGKKLIGHYMRDASSKLYVYNLNGAYENEIDLPGYCTVTSLQGDKNDSLFFYTVTGYTQPGTIYKYNLINGIQEIYYRPEIPEFNAEEYVTTQVIYESKDGTKIPMFLVGKKERPDEGDPQPVLLHGYGGFNISKTPEFLIERLPFLEAGGMLALPSLRGGGEYGSGWHKAGTKLNKQNVFDDFIAAAEYLIERKITTPEQLAISGRSNGGLLVGAAMTQRPDLFRVALPAVGVMDMIRFHKFTIGWAWMGDYGSPENPEEFKALFRYSPYHNLRPGTSYPATLVTTADHDDRVIPGHSYKFIAALQKNQASELPVLIRIDEQAGHGVGKPVAKIIDEQADIFSFMMYHLNMRY